MTTIANTNLSYSEADEIALDYFLGGDGEDKIAWAQRVDRMCKEYADTNGVGYPESGYGDKGMPNTYARSAESLWAEKKSKRRHALAREVLCFHSDNPDDTCMQTCKLHANYKSRDAFDAEQKAVALKRSQEIIDKKAKRVADLRAAGFSDDVIISLAPNLEGSL
jgi:hypothetical protein